MKLCHDSISFSAPSIQDHHQTAQLQDLGPPPGPIRTSTPVKAPADAVPLHLSDCHDSGTSAPDPIPTPEEVGSPIPIYHCNKKSNALLIGPIEYSSYVKKLWPNPISIATHESPVHMAIFQTVCQTSLPNYLSAKVQIPSDLNCDTWEFLLNDYHDQEICNFLRFGWPSNFTAPRIPTPTHRNHPSATAYSAEIDSFLVKELQKGALLGPFDKPPFFPWTHNSPLMMAEKKDSLKRRVIIYLSFPHGASVNDGVAKNYFQGEPTSYVPPTVHDLASMIIQRGPGSLIWKTDLECAYRQLRSDPLDYLLMGISHKGKHYINICPSFGSRGSSAAQQRVSSAICFLMAKKGFETLAYVDDFCGAHTTYEEAKHAFAVFESLAETLGIKIAPEKSSYPSTSMEWLGFHFDTKKMEVTIPAPKLQEVLDIAAAWATKKSATRREYQVLAGKLNHIALCILPARRFMSRILTALRSAPQTGYVKVTPDVRRDVAWFSDYAEACNGRYLLRPITGSFIIECNACLEGGGGFSDTRFYSTRFPLQWMLDHHMSHLESLNLIIAIKTLIPDGLICTEVIVRTDNIASAYALTTGKARDPVIAACARELWLVAATKQLTITVQHVPGKSLVLADALSRRHKTPEFEHYIIKTVNAMNLMSVPPVTCDHVLTPTL